MCFGTSTFAGAILIAVSVILILNLKGESIMSKSRAGKLASRVFTLFTLLACLSVGIGDQATKAAGEYDDWRSCMSQGHYWCQQYSFCVEYSVVNACEGNGTHQYNVCTGECKPIQ